MVSVVLGEKKSPVSVTHSLSKVSILFFPLAVFSFSLSLDFIQEITILIQYMQQCYLEHLWKSRKSIIFTNSYNFFIIPFLNFLCIPIENQILIRCLNIRYWLSLIDTLCLIYFAHTFHLDLHLKYHLTISLNMHVILKIIFLISRSLFFLLFLLHSIIFFYGQNILFNLFKL